MRRTHRVELPADRADGRGVREAVGPRAQEPEAVQREDDVPALLGHQRLRGRAREDHD